jgi:uncharacterized membrane protein
MVAPSAAAPLTQVEVPEQRPERSPRRTAANVGQLERAASIMVGSLLVANGVKRLSLTGLAIAGAGAALIQRGSSGVCPMYSALGVTTQEDPGEDSWTAGKMLSNPLHQHIRVERSVTIAKPVEEVYAYWRKLENLPSFMEHLASVKEEDGKRSHWVARSPRGKRVEWHAEIVREEANKALAWKSVENADVQNAGQVLFETGGEGETVVKVLLTYAPPAGVVGAVVARLFGEEPHQQIKEDLRHLKQILEAGEKPSIEGQPQGKCK